MNDEKPHIDFMLLQCNYSHLTTSINELPFSRGRAFDSD